MMVEVINQGENFRYNFWGGNSVIVKGFEMSGKLLSEAPIPDFADAAFEQFHEMLEHREPMAFKHFGSFGKSFDIELVTVRLPLSSNGTDVTQIFSYQSLGPDKQMWIEVFDELWRGKRQDKA